MGPVILPKEAAKLIAKGSKDVTVNMEGVKKLAEVVCIFKLIDIDSC